ncbi:hypothetical protein [Streptomyces sp. NPDC096132]|uniref:hypothetical protein n=1 Tax=Streptomyces sp. NPDC096132 TaxID=3366075 RepID=UPI00382D68B6
MVLADGSILRTIAEELGHTRLLVGGFSMGGIVARYALAKMEMRRSRSAVDVAHCDALREFQSGRSPESGRFSARERRSDARELADRFSELRSSGQGYLEVRLPDREFPQLSLGFRGDHAVIHLIDDAERMSLLVGPHGPW